MHYTKTAKWLTFSLGAVLLSGCASGPDLHPSRIASEHPALAAAIRNAHTDSSLSACGFLSGSGYKTCKTRLLLESAGPAVLVPMGVKTGKISTSKVNDIMAAVGSGSLVAGLALGSLSSVASGLFLLGGSHQSHHLLTGFYHYTGFKHLYAVRWMNEKNAVQDAIPDAVHLAVSVPSLASGNMVGWSGYNAGTCNGIDSVFEPEKLLKAPQSNTTYSITFHSSVFNVCSAPGQMLSPQNVWQNNVHPILKRYAVTAVWRWDQKDLKTRYAFMKRASAHFPKWAFVYYWGQHGSMKHANLLCQAGTCHWIAFNPKPS